MNPGKKERRIRRNSGMTDYCRRGKMTRCACMIAAVFCILLLSALPGNSFAASKAPVFWISPTGEYSIDAINVYQDDGKAYLFLPGNTDLTEYRIGFDSETLRINGEEAVYSQTPASVLSTEKANDIVLTNKKKKTKMSLTVMEGSALPSMYILTESGSLKMIHKDKKEKEAGSLILYDSDGSCLYSGSLKHIKMRGNSSVKYQKKNYAIKLENGASLLGMGKAKRWILLGNHLDKSLIRNQMVFDIARYAGMAYTPDCRQVAVYINHEYMGLYLLTEKIEPDDDRVDIRDLGKETKRLNENDPETYPVFGNHYANRGSMKGFSIPNEPDDITGGYIIEYDHDLHNYAAEPSVFVTDRCMAVIVHSPEYCSEAQIRYISGLMQGFENAIFTQGGRDPETGKHYSEFVDFDSLVNKYLINEISKNYDSNMASEYFYKPDDSVSEKVYAGPVWDMDNTFGIYARADTRNILLPTGMLASRRGALHYWWPELYRQPDFYQAVVERYHETFVPALEILLGQREESENLKSIDTYAAAIEKSAAMEYARYPYLKRKRYQIQTGSNLKENADYLKKYITKRMKYLSGVWITE